jgi:hypothetical protein
MVGFYISGQGRINNPVLMKFNTTIAFTTIKKTSNGTDNFTACLFSPEQKDPLLAPIPAFIGQNTIKAYT